MKSLCKLIFLVCFLLVPSLVSAQTYTETHYVTQSGAGSKTGRSLSNAWALSNFNNTANWSTVKAVDGKIGPGDVVFFNGNFTDRVIITRGGSSAGSITLDGFANGDCSPLEAICYGSALLQQGMEVASKTNNIEYVTIQDFRMTDPNYFRPTLQVKGSAPNFTYPVNRMIIRRNYVYESGNNFLSFFYGKYNIITDNKFYIFGKQNNPPDRVTGGAIALIEFSNSIFARNEVGHDGSPIKSGSMGSPELVHTHGCQNLLIEYNDLYGTPGQSGLRPKEHPAIRPSNYNHVIRFNKIHDNPNTTMGKGLYINTRPNEPISNFYIYGNYIYKNGLMGLAVGEGVSNVYAWANILTENGRHGICVYDTTGTSKNYHFYNNTIARNNRLNESDVARGGIVVTSGSQIHIKNNILWNNRPAGERNRIQIASWITISSLEHNIYFHNLNEPYFYYKGGYRTLATMNSMYGFETEFPSGAIKDPLFVNPIGTDKIYGTVYDNYRLSANSYLIDRGKSLPGRFSINISGGDSWFEKQTGYGVLNFGFDDALCPIETDWTTNPPKVIGAKQGENGKAWEIGAYVYKDNSRIETSLTPPKIININSY